MSVVEAVERDIRALGGDLGDSTLAASALVLAAQMDRRVSWAIAKELRETMAELRALAPPKEEKDGLDDLARRRAERLSGGAASADSARS